MQRCEGHRQQEGGVCAGKLYAHVPVLMPVRYRVYGDAQDVKGRVPRHARGVNRF